MNINSNKSGSISNPLISIILPVYNGQKFLDKSIQSILSQTYSDFELIVVDDCSTDLTPDIIKRFEKLDSRIKSFRNPFNKKLPASLNLGHKVASGDYFTWTSDDNLLRNNFLQVLVERISERDSDLIFANYFLVDYQGEVLKPFIAGPLTKIFIANVWGCAFLYKRAVYEDLKGYDENLYLVEDYDFWLRAICKFKAEHISDFIYYYRIHEDSLSSKIESNELYKYKLEKGIRTIFLKVGKDMGWSKTSILMTPDLYFNKNIGDINLLLNTKDSLIKDWMKSVSLKGDESKSLSLLLYKRIREILLKDNVKLNFFMLIIVLIKAPKLLLYPKFSKKYTLQILRKCVRI